jgi:hypothetical protein
MTYPLIAILLALSVLCQCAEPTASTAPTVTYTDSRSEQQTLSASDAAAVAKLVAGNRTRVAAKGASIGPPLGRLAVVADGRTRTFAYYGSYVVEITDPPGAQQEIWEGEACTQLYDRLKAADFHASGLAR